MLHFGAGHYGKVDQVPGLFHVKTKFFHVHFLPLIPLGSHLHFEDAEESDATPIGWCWKSILIAWLRALLVAGGGFLAIVALTGLIVLIEDFRHWKIVLGLVVGACLCFSVLYFSFRWTHARPERALCLARHAGLEPEELAEYFVDHPALANLEELRTQAADETG